MGRVPCCDQDGLKRGPWTAEEDQKLVSYIQKHGHGSWRTLPKNAGLSRCGKSCRLRWTNYLRPDIKRGRFSFEEEETIIHLHSILGNKWSAIAAQLPGRTDNEIKNFWNTHIKKRLMRMGIDPVTHSPRLDLLDQLSMLLNPPPLLNYSKQLIDVSKLLSLEHYANDELLRMAANLISHQHQPQQPNNIVSNNHHHHQPLHQFQDYPFPPFEQCQQQQQLIQVSPPCTTTTASSQQSQQILGEAQQVALQPQADMSVFQHVLQPDNYIQSNSSFSWDANCALLPLPTTTTSTTSSSFLEQFFDGGVDQSVIDQLVPSDSNFSASCTQSLTSAPPVISSSPTSSLTQLNSSPVTTNLNSNSTCTNQDDIDSFCSTAFDFQMPDLLDVSAFM